MNWKEFSKSSGMTTGKWFIENSRDHTAKIFDYLEAAGK